MKRRRLATCVAVTAVLATAGDAAAADRTDPIPATVGPPGAIGFYVNPTAPGLDPVRVQAVMRRSLARWGNTYLGVTDAKPGVGDGLNVIGVATLPEGILGQMQGRSSNQTVVTPGSRTCTPVQREPGDTVRRENRRLRAKLRRDVLRRGRVVKRTIRRALRVPKFTRVRAPVTTQQCTVVSSTANATASHEFDVLLAPEPDPSAWALGPALPSAAEYDFETVVLHELGHVSGLAHHADDCDPSTPMAAGGANGGYWHAVDAWRLPSCPVENPPAPAPVVLNGADSSEPLPGAGATALAGRGIHINPRVPAGYDSARFVAVAARAIRRAGGTPLGVTGTPPASGDGQSVLGFAPLDVNVLTTSLRVPHEQVVESYAVQTCPAKSVRLRRRVVVRRHVRRGGRRLRSDVIRTRTRRVAGYACTSALRPPTFTALASELDLRVNELTVAWELGPRLPTDGTRWDLETALLQNVMSAGGAPPGSDCDTTTPNTLAGAAPGDWWRSAAEVSRAGCAALASTELAAARRLRTHGGRVIAHRATGLPDDVPPVP